MKENTTTINDTVGVPLDGGTPREERSVGTLRDLSYNERLLASIEMLSRLSEAQGANVDLLSQIDAVKGFCPLLADLDAARFPELLATMKRQTPPQSDNVFAAFLLFYVMSGGKYPQDCWEGATAADGKTTLGAIREDAKALSYALSSAGAADLAESANVLARAVRRKAERADLESLTEGEAGVGRVKIYELLWEVFVEKYENFSVAFWIKKIAEFRDMEFAIREGCEYRERRGNAEIYAVSYEGKLSKPMHDHCEDCCLVTFFDKSTWLAVSADGVGSCVNSYFGSEFAVKALRAVIEKYLKRNRIVGRRRTRDEQGNRQRLKAVSDDAWAKLMHYLRFGLAKDFHSAWELAVRSSDAFKSDPNAELVDFTSTLQFAFGCKAFIACGRVGDGAFFVRKREGIGANRTYGCFFLNDGISGVTQTSVFSVAHLKKTPSALQVDFFRPEEVSDIVITSDGAESALGATVTTASAFTRRMRELPFDARCEALSAMARDGSDYNETARGTGDDSTIVHIVLKSAKGEE
ncbi:MAG: protein phosphatase 2C domain-containing protein [Clostridia bacterium]|nr:protein phosphatase 2C domain-containing protein [Clostridia bacterium]